jgi:hypothetical protein
LAGAGRVTRSRLPGPGAGGRPEAVSGRFPAWNPAPRDPSGPAHALLSVQDRLHSMRPARPVPPEDRRTR